MKRNAMRSGGSARFCAAEIDSNHGSDIEAPAPRKKVRRERRLDIAHAQPITDVAHAPTRAVSTLMSTQASTKRNYLSPSRCGRLRLGGCAAGADSSAPPCVFRKGTLST